MLAASNAHAAVEFRWPWEKATPRSERNDRNTRREPIPQHEPPVYRERGSSEDAAFLIRMHESLQEEMAFADAVRRENRIREVRDFAERTLAETRAFDEDIRRRAQELGIRLDERRYDARSLAKMHDADMAVEWLRLSMDVIGRDRFYSSEYKTRESNRAFHSVLSMHWDRMVDRRDDAKYLHDRVRNEERARRRHNS